MHNKMVLEDNQLILPELKTVCLISWKKSGYDGYFGTKRYDRRVNSDGKIERIHMISVSALLETSHRIPNLDYDILMKLTLELTKDFTEAEKLYRLMCFNVFAHNREDYSKKFTFLYEKKKAAGYYLRHMT